MNDDGGQQHRPALAGGPPSADGSARPYVLTINGGSSSLKFAVFAAADPIERVLSGRVERVGLGGVPADRPRRRRASGVRIARSRPRTRPRPPGW